MQSNTEQIYKLTAERENKPEQLYKDLGNFVFASLYKKLRRPSSLIVKLKGVGTWYLRKKRIEELVNKYPPSFRETPEDRENLGVFEKLKLFEYENKVEIYNIFKERLKDYENYIAERDIIRKKRYATQKILTSKETS